jgi:DNA polymerase-3 subunit epsilon
VNLALARLRNRWRRSRMQGKALHPLALANLSALDGIQPELPARSHRYVVLDLETTGLDSDKDRVVSVGALRMVEGRVRLGEVFDELVNPGRDIPVESIKVHAIVPDMIADARPAGEVFEDLMRFVGTDVIVAHYAPFDLHFLNKIMKVRYGFTLQNLVLDTVEVCRATLLTPDPHGVYMDYRKCGLDALAERYGLEMPERHTALGDALATALIFQRLLQHLEQTERGSMGELIKIGAVAM